MGRLRKRKQSVTHGLSERERERTLQQRGVVGSFINTRPRSSRWFESPDSRPAERPPVAHNVGSSMRHVHSLPCYESPAHPASTPKAIPAPRRVLLAWPCFTVCLSSSLSVASPLMPSRESIYIFCTLTTPRLNGEVRTPSASVK
jgi:hypothetical protein